MFSRVDVYHSTDLSRVPILAAVEGGSVVVFGTVILKSIFNGVEKLELVVNEILVIDRSENEYKQVIASVFSVKKGIGIKLWLATIE